MGLLPLAWLAVHGERRREWWWLAVVFAVSWLADSAVDLGADAYLASAVYPFSQAAIVGAVLLPRGEARFYATVLAVVGIVSVLVAGVVGREFFLRTVAWGGIVGMVGPLPLGKLRAALLVTFGLGWFAWIVYALAPTWTSWGAYQGVRGLGIAVFCWASIRPHPSLRLATQ